MSAPQFTPGPWKACKDGACSCGFIWSIPADFHLATANQSWGDETYPDGTMSLEEMQANARLIAAAPELYEAAAQLLNALDLDSESVAAVELRDPLRAALTKARGETPIQEDAGTSPKSAGDR